jgi:hypothetical protein
LALLGWGFLFAPAVHAQGDSAYVRRIYDLALRDGKAYEWLGELTTKVPSRLSGSKGADEAVDWAEALMKSLGVETRRQACEVPHWVRGVEKGYIVVNGKKIEVPVCALGGSVATPPEGITAGVVEVKSFDMIDQLGEMGLLKDKIVFYNEPMNPTYINTFRAYGEAVRQRWSGAIKAAPYGALGVVVRSMTLRMDDVPHTGSMGYEDSIPKIPACAISTLGAEKLSEYIRSNPGNKFSFTLTCKTMEDKTSYNVIGEIKGTEHPEEIITVGGHLDAWDLGVGAHDDGGGCMQAVEVLRIFKTLGIRPKRTIRAVMFMNEENGGRGGKKYAEEALAKGEKHIAAIESDAGSHTPRGLSFKGDSMRVENLMRWQPLFAPYLADHWIHGYGGADINHLGTELCPELDCLVLIGLSPDSQRYFDYHHSWSDTFDKVNKREIELCAALMASTAYLLSEHGIGE